MQAWVNVIPEVESFGPGLHQGLEGSTASDFSQVGVGVPGIPGLHGSLTSYSEARPGRRASALHLSPSCPREGSQAPGRLAVPSLQTPGWCPSNSPRPAEAGLLQLVRRAPALPLPCAPDTVLLRWLLQVTREQRPRLQQREGRHRVGASLLAACCWSRQGPHLEPPALSASRYFRYGAPPVINPLGTSL